MICAHCKKREIVWRLTAAFLHTDCCTRCLNRVIEKAHYDWHARYMRVEMLDELPPERTGDRERRG